MDETGRGKRLTSRPFGLRRDKLTRCSPSAMGLIPAAEIQNVPGDVCVYGFDRLTGINLDKVLYAAAELADGAAEV